MVSEARRVRTEQKLRFAELHVGELGSMPAGRGDDFERAHQEAVLAQLLGAYHAFLNELNVLLGCGRKEEDVSLGKLRESLKARGRSSAVLKTLFELETHEQSWLNQVLRLRHASTHFAGIPLAFYWGGPESGKVALKDPRTMQELPGSAVSTLTSWLHSMRVLFEELRQAAESEGAG